MKYGIEMKLSKGNKLIRSSELNQTDLEKEMNACHLKSH